MRRERELTELAGVVARREQRQQTWQTIVMVIAVVVIGSLIYAQL